ncbi:MAG TPA: hypothetical protein VGQ57_12835 [Polyangiaceae bacterium]|jgi:hypothetical protein|nr:hypothetical protein [Polyangiaceae bacterium]
MKKLLPLLAAAACIALDAGEVRATDLYPWNNHASPLGFRFGNDIDMHQQSRVSASGNVAGFLYVQFTGVVTSDGYRVATHGDCQSSRCTVGWTFSGKALEAKLIAEPMHDHPLFFVERTAIPEPGAFSHFHWVGPMPAMGASASGYVLQLAAVDRFCFLHHDAGAAVSGQSCQANLGVKVELGIDVASHLNIVPADLSEDM